jgi:hypothetical protein
VTILHESCIDDNSSDSDSAKSWEHGVDMDRQVQDDEATLQCVNEEDVVFDMDKLDEDQEELDKWWGCLEAGSELGMAVMLGVMLRATADSAEVTRLPGQSRLAFSIIFVCLRVFRMDSFNLCFFGLFFFFGNQF